MRNVRIFKCCMDDGIYRGDGIHDPAAPGDGPWYLSISIDDDNGAVELGFGTAEEAQRALKALVTQRQDSYTIVENMAWEELRGADIVS